MGSLIEMDIPALYNGVSRQPDAIRLPSQGEEADNLTLSVVSGGIEKRDPTEHLATLAGATPTASYALHPVDRDQNERYVVLVDDAGNVRVFDGFDGTEKTVTYDSGFTAALMTYLSPAVHPQQGLAFATLVDTTIIVNRDKTTAMLPAPDPVPTIMGQKQYTTELPTTGMTDGDIWEITNTPTELDNLFVKWVAADSQWIECADPRISNEFDPATMPVRLTRQSDGTFLVAQIEWDARGVGSEITVPAPQFIGKPLRDVFFYKNRLGFLSDTNAYFSQAGDYYNLWPDKATDVLDSDPIDIAVPSSRVSLLEWGLSFRKTLFLTSDKAQFEQSNTGLLTPRTASIEESTTFSSSNDAKPVTMGSELYFAAQLSSSGVVWEYFFDDNTLSNTADNVSKHVAGYIPGGIRRMAGEPASETLFVLAGDPTSSVYVYTVYWNGTEKIQSAWHKWSTEGEILDLGVMGDELYLLVRRSGETMLLRVKPSDIDTDAGFRIRLDQKIRVTGVYDGVTDTTTWTLPYKHNGTAQAILSTDFSTPGRSLPVYYSGSYDVVMDGDFSDGDVVLGFPYRSRYRFSRQFARGEDQKALLQGRTQIRRMKMRFEDTAYFEVHVTPTGRDTKVYKFTGRQVSVLNNIIGQVTLSSGDFDFGVNSRSDAVTIEIISDSHLPFTISSASWVGFFHSTSRAG